MDKGQTIGGFCDEDLQRVHDDFVAVLPRESDSVLLGAVAYRVGALGYYRRLWMVLGHQRCEQSCSQRYCGRILHKRIIRDCAVRGRNSTNGRVPYSGFSGVDVRARVQKIQPKVSEHMRPKAYFEASQMLNARARRFFGL